MFDVKAIGVTSAKSPLEPMRISRREVGEQDILIDIAYCGICHSDLHQVRDEWGGSLFPMVPGHEIAGRVSKVGKGVTRFKVGDNAGVGCMVDSCRTCRPCERGLEQFCRAGAAMTYNGTEMDRATPTQGGYSTQIVVNERFALRIGAGANLAGTAPLLCAGITTWSPLRHWKVGAGSKVGVVGLGGLGHMAVKLAASMGAEVTLLSTSRAKEADAKRLGAAHFVLTTERAAMRPLSDHFDLLIDTISAPHDYNTYLELLDVDGVMVLLGVPPAPTPVHAFSLITGRKTLAGSLIGGIAETQEMLDYCAEKGIVADVEVIPSSACNEAYERMLKGDVRYRFAIDAKTL